MQARLKIMTVLVTMTAMFAMLPALSAVAAEPLDDGSYTVVAGGETLALQVTDGQPLVADTPGVEWFFAFDDEERVLDEFDVVVDGLAYEVEIGEDGTAFVTGKDVDFVPPAPEVPLAEEFEADEEPEEEEEEEAEDEPEAEEEDDADDAHGELVSAVAQCAPSGRAAREAGLPNHGEVVSAVAKGEVLTFTIDGVDDEFVIDGELGADAVCAELEEAQTAGEAAAEAAAEDDAEDDADEASRGNGKPADSEDAETAGDAPGKSGNAAGKAKKGQQD